MDGTPEGTALRAVEQYASFVDPGGLTVEIAYGCQDADTVFSSPVLPEGFVTGELGMGHIAFASPNNRESEAFYIDVLGARLSDHINHKMAGGELEISFLHFNPRHHTYAFASANDINPIVAKKALAKKMIHFMCEYPDIRSVLQAQERIKAAKIPFALTLGEHTNDKDVSFYVVTPSGFHLEVGAGALQIDDSTWVPQKHNAISIWGHEYQLGGGPILGAVQKWLLR
jgi:2,3-dihydroxybiphenyl 1,2-dioxygenase